MAARGKIEDHITGVAGAGVGIVTSEFLSELVARLLNATGNMKAGAKIVTKVLLGLTLIALIPVLPLGWSMFFLMMAWGGMGSIFVDLIVMAKPGGIPAIVDELVGVGAGATAAARELARFEVGKVAPSEVVPAEAVVRR